MEMIKEENLLKKTRSPDRKSNEKEKRRDDRSPGSDDQRDGRDVRERETK